MKTLILLGLLLPAAAEAGLKFAEPFSHGAVLQREIPVPVWGTGAKPGADVSVCYGRFSVKAKANAKGEWRVDLPAMPATKSSGVLEALSGASKTAVTNVVVGEVWLCSGQSNMAQALVDPKMPRYRDAIGSMIAQTTYKPFVRHMLAPGDGGWHSLTPEYLSSGRRSAIAVYYALGLYSHLDIPVGVIEAAAGGSNIDNWQPEVGPSAGCNNKFMKKLYPYALRGALWYQGETNAMLGEADVYPEKMRRLLNGWRKMFENKELSFYYVQLAPFARGVMKNGFDYDAAFPKFLMAQSSFEKMDPRAAMTVVNDIGCVEDIHPNEKWLVARRLLLHALKRNYGFEGVEDSSPLALSATADGSRVKVVFSNAKSLYVYARGKAFSKSLAPFEIAGSDGVFKPAQIINFSSEKGFARGLIDSSEIVLSASGVKEPVAVRYAWQKPWTGCVYNEADLPMGTFLIEVGK